MINKNAQTVQQSQRERATNGNSNKTVHKTDHGMVKLKAITKLNFLVLTTMAFAH
jgi:hypothetical protein